jgi:hypothetical protein
MPFCLNMEYPRYRLGKLNACAFMCVMNSCKKMFIQLFSNETVMCAVLCSTVSERAVSECRDDSRDGAN